MGSDDYGEQGRGGLAAYERYLAGMGASMRQKVALTAAHLLCEGRIADMGMGSGQGSHALAALYPRLEVIGVDIDPTMVALARERYRLANLSFACGDIARPEFPAESLDGILDSSVLHHVTSYGGYRHANAAEALAAQVALLRPHGVLVVRDFVDPGSGPVLLDLPGDDGDSSGDPLQCSTAALLERFSREFRLLSAQPGFPLEAVGPSEGLPPPPSGWRRYRLAHKHAAEFVLRKDYRRDWASEVKEEYTYFTQSQFEATIARLGLRMLASTPLRNPWIVRHRFEGKFLLRDERGAPIEAPATNYVIVGEKVPAHEGVAFQRDGQAPPCGFLRLEHHRHRSSRKVFDLAARPHPTIDVIPFFEQAGRVYLLARTSYPRPILHGHASLDGASPPGYVAEPLNVLQTELPTGATVERALGESGIRSGQIRRMLSGTTYYPSPGGIMEEVRSVLVEIEPVFANAPIQGASAFSTSGRLRAIEACQLLRAAQVGGLPDARLELNTYELLLRLGRPLGPWIGGELSLEADFQGAFALDRSSWEVLPPRVSRRVFESATDSAGFLHLDAADYQELSATGQVLFQQTLESVRPVSLSGNTVAVAPLARAGDDVVMGVDEDDLPAAQAFSGNSDLLVAPAWRLPHEVRSVSNARDWIASRLAGEYGVSVGSVGELGGPYRPSAGLTPETVFPLAVEVLSVGSGSRALTWIPLRTLVSQRAAIPDGHLRVLSLRAAHAVGSI